MKKLAILVGILVLMLFSLTALVGMYDFWHTPGEPIFHKASSWFCITEYVGITLPPFGIYICEEYFDDENIRAHELVHWDQYKKYSTLGFYLRYIHGWISAGFNYTDNWMEKEARGEI